MFPPSSSFRSVSVILIFLLLLHPIHSATLLQSPSLKNQPKRSKSAPTKPNSESTDISTPHPHPPPNTPKKPANPSPNDHPSNQHPTATDPDHSDTKPPLPSQDPNPGPDQDASNPPPTSITDNHQPPEPPSPPKASPPSPNPPNPDTAQPNHPDSPDSSTTQPNHPDSSDSSTADDEAPRHHSPHLNDTPPKNDSDAKSQLASLPTAPHIVVLAIAAIVLFAALIVAIRRFVCPPISAASYAPLAHDSEVNDADGWNQGWENDNWDEEEGKA